MLLKLSLKQKPVLIDVIEKQYFQCAFCPEVRLGNTALKLYTDSKHSNEFSCKKCDYIAEDTYTLRQHQLFHHQIVSVDQEKIENKFFKCTFCPKDHQMVSVGQKR